MLPRMLDAGGGETESPVFRPDFRNAYLHFFTAKQFFRSLCDELKKVLEKDGLVLERRLIRGLERHKKS